MLKTVFTYKSSFKSYILVFLLFIASCTEEQQSVKVSNDFDEISSFDSLVNIDIDKATRRADVLLNKATTTDDFLKAYYFKARVSVQNGNAKDLMYYGDKLLILSDSVSSSFYKNKINILLGRYYIQQSSYSFALEYLIEAENYFEENNDSLNLSAVYNGLGILNFDLREYDKAKQYFQKTYKIHKKQNNDRGVGIYYANIGNVYNITKEYDKALKYQQKALDVFTTLNDTTSVVSSLINISNIQASLGNTATAKEKLDEAMLLTNKDKARLKERILFNYALLFWTQKQYDKVEQYLTLHSETADSLEQSSAKLDGLDLKIMLADVRHNYKEKAIYTKNFYQLKDSLYGSQVNKKVEELQWQNEFEKSRLESQFLQSKYTIEKDRNTYLTYSVILVVLFFIVVVGFIWVLYKNIKNNLKLTKISNEKLHEKIQVEQLEKEKQQVEHEVLKLKSEQQKTQLEVKNREITSINLQLLAKNKIMSDISKVLSKKDKTVAIIEKELKSILFQNQNQEKEWLKFKEIFDKIHPGFFENIQTEYPKLSNTDLRICAYIKMRMSLHETSNLLNITLQSLHTSRYRMRKKMNLSSEDNLDEYIHSL